MDHHDNSQPGNNRLIKLNDELENYFRNTVIPQLFVDANLILRKFTPPAMKHFNLSSADIGKNIKEISHNIRFPSIMDNINEVIESQQILEKEIQTTDLRWYQMNILPYIIQKENKPNGVIITFVDITDRIEVLQGYEKLNKHYENIIYSISHDLKGSFVNIEWLVQLLKESPCEEKIGSKSVIDMLSTSLDKLRKTIVEITDISREKNHAKTEERVKFENVIEDTLLALKDKIVDTEAKITTEFNVSETSFDRKKIRSIIYNLLSNALKYKAPKRAPAISIKTEKLNEYLLLSIKDNGLGIAEDKHKMIFSQYTRLNNDIEGTGIGLFIVKKMVKESGGKVEVESSLGEGSTFKVYLKE